MKKYIGVKYAGCKFDKSSFKKALEQCWKCVDNFLKQINLITHMQITHGCLRNNCRQCDSNLYNCQDNRKHMFFGTKRLGLQFKLKSHQWSIHE